MASSQPINLSKAVLKLSGEQQHLQNVRYRHQNLSGFASYTGFSLLPTSKKNIEKLITDVETIRM